MKPNECTLVTSNFACLKNSNLFSFISKRGSKRLNVVDSTCDGSPSTLFFSLISVKASRTFILIFNLYFSVNNVHLTRIKRSKVSEPVLYYEMSLRCVRRLLTPKPRFARKRVTGERRIVNTIRTRPMNAVNEN